MWLDICTINLSSTLSILKNSNVNKRLALADFAPEFSNIRLKKRCLKTLSNDISTLIKSDNQPSKGFQKLDKVELRIYSPMKFFWLAKPTSTSPLRE